MSVTVCVASEPAAAAVRAVTPGDVPVTTDVPEAGDVVLVREGVRLAPGWLEALVRARGEDGTVATVDALAVAADDLAGAQARLLTADGALTPRHAEPTWACTLVTGPARQLAGSVDAGFAARCSAAGLLHVIADDALAGVHVAGGADDEPEPVARARGRAAALLEPLAVTIDARILRSPIAGTQVHTLELLAALHRTGDLRLRALVPPDPTPTARAVLDSLDGLEQLNSDEVDDGTPATPIVHRPYQVTSALDLLTLRQVGERLVVTHQDLLTYHNRAYHLDEVTWQAYRELTVAAMRSAHTVVAFSEHAARELHAEGLVDNAPVVPIGVDHRLAELATVPRRPEGAPDGPYLLCIGTDLRHKNRPFAAALVAALRERHGWPGQLVLAGPHAQEGASEPVEGLDLGTPNEAEKAWLYEHAAAVVYPTTYEGFGLIPFEAAAHGTPCLFAPQASLLETLGELATLIPWDAAASAARAHAVLTEPAPLVEGIRAVAAPLTWDATAAAMVGVYQVALSSRPPVGAWALLEAEAARRDFEDRYWALFNSVGPTGWSLVGPDGSLPQSAQRPLAALARRPVTRRPLLAVLNALGRVTGR